MARNKKQRPLTSVDCLLHGHCWHATFEQGRLLCTVCGKPARCPDCFPHTAPIRGVALVYCPLCRARHTRVEEHQLPRQGGGPR